MTNFIFRRPFAAHASKLPLVLLMVLVATQFLRFPGTTTTTSVFAVVTALTAPSRIAILGSTGNLGRQTVTECLRRDIPVRLLVRPSSMEKLPEEFKNSPLVQVVSGDLLAATASTTIFDDETIAPSAELLRCLEGCGSVVCCYGATRRTKLSDLFRNQEDTDPIHAKQINYRSMIALVAACKAVNEKAAATTSGNVNGNKNESNIVANNSNVVVDTIQHIVRITGKGEDPNGFFSILLNGLGAYCKAWNYQGEVALRTLLAEESIGYTIVRPGILKKEDDAKSSNKKEAQQQQSFANDDLELADNGGNDLKVTQVGYSQIANLLIELVLSAGDGRISPKAQNHRVTLAAMNPSSNDADAATTSAVGIDPGEVVSTKKKSLAEKIAALRNDRREFPKSLVAEHKAAVAAFFTKVALVLSAFAIALATLLSKIF